MVRISTFESLDDVVIEDEYDIDEMERLDILSRDDDFAVPDPIHCQDYWQTNPSFRDLSAWDEYRPNNENFRLYEAEDTELFLGRIWTNKEEAKKTVGMYSVEKRVEFRVTRSNLNTWECVCKSVGQNCPWGIQLKKSPKFDYWKLRQYGGDHICYRNIILSDNIHLNAKMIAEHFGPVLREKLRLDVMMIQAEVAKHFGYKIKYLKAWQAKQVAMGTAFGTWEESFAKLPHLMEVMQEHIPGTYVAWETSPLTPSEIQIDRVFWAFGPAIRAFEHCRPVLSVDGTHLYGKYNGRLLVAIGMDADNQILPVAFALVESENNSSWKWFMGCIREGVTGKEGLCVISDRHKGILAAMDTMEEWMPPRGYHRYCMRHLKSNFNDKLKNDVALKDELGRIGYMVDPIRFQQAFSHLLECLHDRPRVREWLSGIPCEKWSLAFDGGRRWGAMTTNASECFNNILKGGRDLPICALVKFTYTQTNEYFVTRRDTLADSTSPFAPMVDKQLQELIEQGKHFRCVMFDRDDMIVRVEDGGIHNHFQVNMREKTCSCGMFVATHLPCSHALRVCREYRLDIADYVPYEYTMQAYNNTWSHVFGDIPRESRWGTYTGCVFFPNPRYRRTAMGRHPTRRIRNEMDWPDNRQSQTQSTTDAGESSGSRPQKKIQRCKTCGQTGHNSRSCSVGRS